MQWTVTKNFYLHNIAFEGDGSQCGYTHKKCILFAFAKHLYNTVKLCDKAKPFFLKQDYSVVKRCAHITLNLHVENKSLLH